MLATVNEKGQITLPSKLRDQMGILPGARLDLQLGADGSLQVRLMARGASSLFGLLAKSGERARSLEEMDAAVSQVVCASVPSVHCDCRRHQCVAATARQ